MSSPTTNSGVKTTSSKRKADSELTSGRQPRFASNISRQNLQAVAAAALALLDQESARLEIQDVNRIEENNSPDPYAAARPNPRVRAAAARIRARRGASPELDGNEPNSTPRSGDPLVDVGSSSIPIAAPGPISSAEELPSQAMGLANETRVLNSAPDNIDQTNDIGANLTPSASEDEGLVTAANGQHVTVLEAGPKFTTARRWQHTHPNPLSVNPTIPDQPPHHESMWQSVPSTVLAPPPFLPFADPSNLIPKSKKALDNKKKLLGRYGPIPSHQQGKWASELNFQRCMHNRWDEYVRKDKAHADRMMANLPGAELANLVLAWEINKRGF